MFRKIILLFVFLFGVAGLALAQDSLKSKLPDIRKKSSGLFNRVKSKSTISTPTPSLSNDSLSTKVNAYTQEITSSQSKLTHKIDSLKTLNLPTEKYQNKLDSLSKINPLEMVQQQEAKVKAGLSKATSVVGNTQNKLREKISSVQSNTDLPISSGGLANSSLAGAANVSLPGASLANSDLSIPGADLPNASIPGASLPGASLPNASIPNGSMPQLPTDGVTNEIKNITNAPAKEIGELKNNGEVKSVTSDIGAASKLGEKAKEYKNDAQGIVNGDQQSISKASDKLENKVKNTGELKDLTNQTQQIGEVKKMTEMAESPEALHTKAIEEAKKQAVNHFAGKEEVLKTAMDKISKYKQKYSSLSSLSDIPKRIPNEMKGKPFGERVLPGISFQVMRFGGQYRIDINPWVGYRLTGHITLGAGWNERFTFHHTHYNGQQHLYGPRAFGEYRIGRGYWVRAELETMNTYIPPNQKIFDPEDRRWIWGSFVGFKKRYRIYKNFYGTAQVLYNMNSLFGKHHINLYADPLAARIGFEFPRKAKNSAMIQ